jgi:hypothetical protein
MEHQKLWIRLRRIRDQAFNIIKKLITIYSMPTDFDSSLVSIFNRLNTLETRTTCLGNWYSTLREHFNYVLINSEPSSWYPMVKITISGETFHDRCDIMSEFCLMPKDVYESLSLWKLSEGGEEISLTNNCHGNLETVAMGRLIGGARWW